MPYAIANTNQADDVIATNGFWLGGFPYANFYAFTNHASKVGEELTNKLAFAVAVKAGNSIVITTNYSAGTNEYQLDLALIAIANTNRADEGIFTNAVWVNGFRTTSITATNDTRNLVLAGTTNWVGTSVGGGSFYGNGANVTNWTYFAITNANNTGNIALGQVMFTNLSGNITLTGYSGKSSGDNLAATAVLIAYADGADRNVTLPAGTLS